MKIRLYNNKFLYKTIKECIERKKELQEKMKNTTSIA